ncbi:MAG: protein kinase [Deltaproteobacteria bacterium]|nr:protein kinase [Deltaproteobacteria bacterium]
MSEDLHRGEMVGEYRIDRKIAEGGMGSVYAALHPLIDKRAAIKVLLHQHCRRTELVQRFIDEARAVNRIGHEHIVDVFAFGELQDGRSYFVMEWLEGESLAARIARGRVGFAMAIHIIAQLCDALAAAHAKGIVHRDLKPANVFLVSGRQEDVFVKLLDFGIAKLGSSDEPRPSNEPNTSPNMVMGTPEYIAPEQAMAAEVSSPADVYALGVIAFELFTGRLPFVSHSPVELLYKHAVHPPPRPSEVQPAIPPVLEELILGMLAKAPAERPSLAQIQARLTEVQRAFTLATGTSAFSRGDAYRPVLGRTFDDLPSLLRALLSELSAGVAWVPASGGAPPVGTPITVRFDVPRLSVDVDLGATVGAVLVDESKSTLVRYDRVSQATLDAIFSIASTVPSEAPKNAESPRTAEWRPPAPSKSPYHDIAFAEAAAVDHPPAAGRPHPEATTRPMAERVSLVDAVIGRSGELQKIATDSALGVVRVERRRAEPAVPDASEGPRRFVGLGAKVLLMAIAISVAAVVSITALAMDQARTDRDFYVRDLNLRMSRTLAAALEERLGRWRDALEIVARGKTADDATLGAFGAVVRCTDRGCETIKGEPIPADLTGPLLAHAPRRRSYLAPMSSGVVIAVRSAQALIAGTVSVDQIISVGTLAPDLGVAVLDEDARVLGASPASLATGFGAHEIARGFSGSSGDSGAREYDAPDGTPMLGAWTRAETAGVFVVVPQRVSLEALRVLGRNVFGVAAVVLVLAAVIAIFFARTMTRRLRVLAQHAGRVARGDFEEPPAVPGKDEVGQLAGAFGVMMEALKERDQEVLRVQRAMSDEESRAVHRQMSAWLETDLAGKLGSIQQLLSPPLDAQAPSKDLQARKGALVELAEQAMGSLRYALLFANISTRRVDLASTVQDSVELARQGPDGRRVHIGLFAPNALLLPRIEGRESEIREAVQRALGWAARSAESRGEVRLELTQDGTWLDLTIELEPLVAAAADRSAIEALRPLVVSNGGELAHSSSGRAARIRMRFATAGAQP